MTDFRTGNGFDVHRFAPDRKLWLCGVEIPHTLGLLGHSDADVALHALCDALLGAAALRDIGFHFPDTDPAYKGADSRVLLRRVAELLGKKGYAVSNVDVTIIAQAPKLSPYIERMRQTVAADLCLDTDRVSVKATTTERLGFTGRGEGIASMASVLIFKA
jgi:ygbB family